jgi:hypothetical protein
MWLGFNVIISAKTFNKGDEIKKGYDNCVVALCRKFSLLNRFLKNMIHSVNATAINKELITLICLILSVI